eukprot:7371895-Heterocapsa_arctica.AAC.1
MSTAWWRACPGVPARAKPPPTDTSSPTTTSRPAATGAYVIGSRPTGVTFTCARSLRAALRELPRSTAVATPPSPPQPLSTSATSPSRAR